jgi:DNA gyrase subunit B
MHCQSLRATVHSSDGKVYEQEYEKEKLYPVNKLVKRQKRNDSNFYPDPTILLKLSSILMIPCQRMRELSF